MFGKEVFESGPKKSVTQATELIKIKSSKKSVIPYNTLWHIFKFFDNIMIKTDLKKAIQIKKSFDIILQKN